MMKSLIVLRGVSAQGKTSTLNRLRESIEDNPNYKVIKSEQHPDGVDWVLISDGPFARIGIITFGDPGTDEHVDVLLNEMHANGVSIIFAASRTRGSVWTALQEFANNNGYKLIVTSTLHSENSDDKAIIDELNSTEAAMLEGLIEKFSII